MELKSYINKTKRDKAITVRLPDETIENIKVIAATQNLSQSEVIEASIKKLGEELQLKNKSILSLKLYIDKDDVPFISIDDAETYDISEEQNKVISLFSGTGGLDIGLELAGFETAACVEVDEHCRETLRYNRPDWKLVEDGKGGKRTPGDIRDITASEILKMTGLKKREAALVVGGAPCQPFSNIGKKEGTECPKNGDLFLEFVKIIKGMRPKGFIFENVSGITQKKHSFVLEYMKEKLSVLGYSVSAKILSAADYGVAQKRERFILIGLYGDQKPAFPIPTNYKNITSYKSFKDTLSESPNIKFKAWSTIQDAFANLDEDYKKRTDYCAMNISESVKNRMKRIGPNQNFKVLPDEMLPDCWKSGKHQGADTFGRMDLKGQSNTIRTAAYNPSKGKYIHPIEHRGLDSIEMSMLQSFPLDWYFKMRGKDKITLKSAGSQIGNAVPPLFAKAIGSALKKQIFNAEITGLRGMFFIFLSSSLGLEVSSLFFLKGII